MNSASLKRYLEEAGPETLLDAGGGTVSLAELMQGLLGQLYRELSEHFGEKEPLEIMLELCCAPLTAPTTTNSFLTVDAAFRRAGFHQLLGLLNEPSAASIQFGHRQSFVGPPLLVYDLGGGTFDGPCWSSWTRRRTRCWRRRAFPLWEATTSTASWRSLRSARRRSPRSIRRPASSSKRSAGAKEALHPQLATHGGGSGFDRGWPGPGHRSWSRTFTVPVAAAADRGNYRWPARALGRRHRHPRTVCVLVGGSELPLVSFYACCGKNSAAK